VEIRLIAGAVAAVALLPACGGADDDATPPAPPAPRAATFAVSAVVDGDTIRLANGTRVRLVQIDAPELSQRECYAQAARANLVELLPLGSRVRLEFDPRLDRVDRNGRRLAYVFLASTNVNVAQVRRGSAAPWFFAGAQGRYARTMMRAARQARASGRGLWSECTATTLDPSRPVDARKPGG
jgi:micrococcal nuclease